MKKRILSIAIIFAFYALTGWAASAVNWLVEKQKGYTLMYSNADKENSKEYRAIIDSGIVSVQAFFGDTFKKEFEIYIHPDRQSLDSQWQKDWNMPDFKSECWMVASGVASKLDMISPKMWDKEACEHTYSNRLKTQQLITHELFHVYHGQLNASPDFSDVTGIDWFVEGLATYASGQCDSARIAEIKKAISENKIPASLDKFWTGKLKYGLSGSVVMYIDKKYGRDKLKELLKFNKGDVLLSTLGITEADLMNQWKTFVTNL